MNASQFELIDTEDTTDPTLLTRLAVIPADDSAWRLFLQRYRHRIHDWCIRWGLRSADIDEVTSAVLLKLVKKLRIYQYDPQGSFRGYLRTVTQNSVRDYSRHRARTGSTGDGDRITTVLDNQIARDELSERLNREFDLELIEFAVQSVQDEFSARDWEVFRLMAFEGQSGDTVAVRCNIPLAYTYIIKGRVLKRFQQLLKELEDGASDTTI